MKDKFAIFILSHGRAHNVKTIDALRSSGYTGDWYIIVDNEDSQVDLYIKNFGEERIIVFDKLKKSLEVETCDQPRDRKVILFARNACFDIAKRLGLEYFLELDDDYDSFFSRYERNGGLSRLYVRDMDSIINEMLEFLENTSILTVAFSQVGDFLSGIESQIYVNRIKRKAMNAFFCKTDRSFDFIGRINEDVNTYVLEGSRGGLFISIADCSLNQAQTQKTSAGMTDVYLDSGTYVKSFYSVITNPSSVKVAEMPSAFRRLHHVVKWEDAVPKIIEEKYKKVKIPK